MGLLFYFSQKGCHRRAYASYPDPATHQLLAQNIRPSPFNLSEIDKQVETYTTCPHISSVSSLTQGCARR
jgi:hypothetical protein